MNMLWLVMSALLVGGCMGPSTRLNAEALSRRLKSQEAVIEDLRNQNRILRETLQSKSEPVEPVVETVDVTLKKGEHFLYAKVIESYRAAQAVDLFRSIEMLEKAYPHSVHLDNSYYLAGLYEMGQHNWQSAQQWFAKTASRFPLGNKVSSALFGEAMAFKQMDNGNQAMRLLMQVRRNYPGSAEAQRAVIEMRNLSEAHLGVAQTEKGWLVK